MRPTRLARLTPMPTPSGVRSATRAIGIAYRGGSESRGLGLWVPRPVEVPRQRQSLTACGDHDPCRRLLGRRGAEQGSRAIGSASHDRARHAEPSQGSRCGVAAVVAPFRLCADPASSRIDRIALSLERVLPRRSSAPARSPLPRVAEACVLRASSRRTNSPIPSRCGRSRLGPCFVKGLGLASRIVQAMTPMGRSGHRSLGTPGAMAAPKRTLNMQDIGAEDLVMQGVLPARTCENLRDHGGSVATRRPEHVGMDR